MANDFINWLNDENQTIVLQRDNTFAMLTWRDFNPSQEAAFNLHTAAWLFILATGIPLLMFS